MKQGAHGSVHTLSPRCVCYPNAAKTCRHPAVSPALLLATRLLEQHPRLVAALSSSSSNRLLQECLLAQPQLILQQSPQEQQQQTKPLSEHPHPAIQQQQQQAQQRHVQHYQSAVPGSIQQVNTRLSSFAQQQQQQQRQQQRQQQPGLVKPVRPALHQAAAQQQTQQQTHQHQDHLLTWRSRRKAPAAARAQPAATGAATASAAAATGQQQQAAQSNTQQQQAATVAFGHTNNGDVMAVPAPSIPQQQQQQQQLQPHLQQLQPLTVAADDADHFFTSPVLFVAATTRTKALAGSISAAFALHQHQLVFAVGAEPLATAVKALATARMMLRANSNGLPVNILMQPTLRGRTSRNKSYALDIARVGVLPLGPSDDEGSGLAGSNLAPIDGLGFELRSKVVHITSSSNEQAAARSLVENMPARGQTIIRVAGPFATETAVLAVALARPLMRKRWGQDLAVLVVWNGNKAYMGRQTGLLLCVFRSAVDTFPPVVLLPPPAAKSVKKAQYWQRQQQQQQPKS